jgi:hypothetical protein
MGIQNLRVYYFVYVCVCVCVYVPTSFANKSDSCEDLENPQREIVAKENFTALIYCTPRPASSLGSRFRTPRPVCRIEMRSRKPEAILPPTLGNAYV